MSESHGKFVWYELMTPDTGAAARFYGGILPWTAKDAGTPGMNYTLFSVGESGVAGMMPMPADAGPRKIPPNWSGYVAVDDLDAAVALVKREGGTIHHGPQDIPDVGRFAVAADPQGAVILLFKPTRSDAPPMPAPDTPGLVGWRELHTADQAGAVAFYAKLFGWSKGDAMDMGPMGTYQIVSYGKGMFGGMFNSPAAKAHPFWLYYFNVAGIDTAKDQVVKGGGTLTNGPMQVPGGAWIVQCIDPQGAHFALVGPKG